MAGRKVGDITQMSEKLASSEIAQSREKRSMTWGDLPEAVRVLCGNLKPPMQPHEWDNLNISEQRDWAVRQLGVSESFLNVERSNHQVSIHQWGLDVAAAERDTRERMAQIVIEEIVTSTGPTGGWLDSPKAITASLLERIRGKE